MGLNPAFDTQQSRPLPLAFGYVFGQGDAVLSITAQDGTSSGTEYAIFLLFEGDCDGIEQMARATTDHLRNPGGASVPGTQYVSPSVYAHFHTGTWGTKGIGAVAGPSTGPDQGVDPWYSIFPSIVPPLTFSGISYAAVTLGPGTLPNLPFGEIITQLQPLAICGVFRSSRCRYFDSNGNVIGYGFTTNPTWHIVETILRYKVKPKQPQIAGLTSAERACFNWPSIVAHAARNDVVLANGKKRFTGHYIFASDATMSTILETQLRCCRSFIREDSAGRIGIYGYDTLDSSFTLTGNHIVPDTFKASQKNLAGAPNIFIPQFRDLDVPALVRVNSAACSGSPLETFFNIEGTTPFAQHDVCVYGDSNNHAMHVDYVVIAEATPGAQVQAAALTSSQSATGGYLGTQDSRFQQRAPVTVQHKQHQSASGQVAPGISVSSVPQPATYDLGNTTYDQANRLMKYQMNSSLGNDAPGWQPPTAGTVTVRSEAVDDDGNAAIALRSGMRFTVDDTVHGPAFAGDYIIDTKSELTFNPPTEQNPLGTIDIPFVSYNPNAATDTSDPPDDAYRTISTAGLPNEGVSLQMSNVAWILQATPAITSATDGSVTVAIPDLVLQILGLAGFSSYPSATWTEVPSGTQCVLYIDDQGSGTTPSFGVQSSALPLASPPAYRYPVLAGTFNPSGSPLYSPSW